jgi:hypothetical protein
VDKNFINIIQEKLIPCQLIEILPNNSAIPQQAALFTLKQETGTVNLGSSHNDPINFFTDEEIENYTTKDFYHLRSTSTEENKAPYPQKPEISSAKEITKLLESLN